MGRPAAIIAATQARIDAAEVVIVERAQRFDNWVHRHPILFTLGVIAFLTGTEVSRCVYTNYQHDLRPETCSFGRYNANSCEVFTHVGTAYDCEKLRKHRWHEIRPEEFEAKKHHPRIYLCHD